ncbi:MAG: hypothetical protein KF819_28125 [Labilithrix sp.]|nr:hypothetical protein [Labilithrix sp.]
MIRRSAAVLVALSACAGPQAPSPEAYGPPPPGWAPHPPEPPPPVTEVTPIAYADAGAPATTPPFVFPDKEPLPIAELVLKPGEPMPKKPLPAPKRIGRGGVVMPGIPSPDRVAIATDKKGSLVDARTGKVLAALPAEPQYVSPRAGVVTLEGKPPRLVRLYDAKVVTPNVDARGRTIRATWLAAAPGHAKALALAETTTGEMLAGVASEDLESFTLDVAPFGPNMVGFSATLNAIDWQLSASVKRFGERTGTPFTLPHEPECVRAKIDDDGAIRCIEHLPVLSLGEDIRWMEDGWLSGGTMLTHVSWGARKILLADQWCSSRGQRTSPPRVVVTCHKNPTAMLWAPGKLFTFPGPADSNDVGGLVGADSGPVLPIREGGTRNDDSASRTVARWIDMPRTRILTTPHLRPMAIASFAGVESLTLAEDKAKSPSVYLLDFEKGTRELVVKINDCPGTIGELRQDRVRGRQRLLILACMTPETKHTIGQDLIWAEIIDTERRVRFRTPLMPEIFFPDGLVVLSTRRRMAAESKTAPGELFSVELPP